MNRWMVKTTSSRLLYAVRGVIIRHEDGHTQLSIDFMTLEFALYDHSGLTLFKKS